MEERREEKGKEKKEIMETENIGVKGKSKKEIKI
jgi:hypothetical protein